MSQIRISVIDPSESSKTTLEVPDDVPVSTLSEAIAESMGLPSKSETGEKIFYYLTFSKGETKENILSLSDTLQESDVKSGDVFALKATTQRTTDSALDEFLRQNIDIHLITPSLLRISMPLPELIKVWDYFSRVTDVMRAIEFIYYAIAILSSNNRNAIEQFLNTLKYSPNYEQLSTLNIYKIIEVDIHPLKVVSSHYGSPASFDLLGIGAVLETVKEITTDVLWRGKHNHQMAELERRNKEVELKQENLATRKTAIEIEAEQIRLKKINA